jgi:drug/metabolite transporter (DMT)-like permease
MLESTSERADRAGMGNSTAAPASTSSAVCDAANAVTTHATLDEQLGQAPTNRLAGTESTGTESTGTESTGSESTGSESTGSNPVGSKLASWDRFVADASLLATCILWGINIPVVKYASSQMDGLAFNASRMVLSTVTLGLLAWLESRVVSQPGGRRSWKLLLVFSLVSGVVYPLAFMLGIDRTTSGNTALLLASMPMWTAVLSALFIKERLPVLTWTALSITFCGTAIVLFSRGNVDFSTSFLIGNCLILSAAMWWASATVISGPLLRQMTPLRMAFWASLLTTPVHLLIVAPVLPATLPKFASVVNFLCLIYSGVFSTGIAYAMWHVGVRRLGGSHAAVYQNVVTLVAVSAGWLVLHEPLLSSQLIGGALMIAGLLLMRFTRGR